MLRDERTRTPKADSAYVFPQAADLYQTDPTGLDRRLRAILTRAGFVDTKPPGTIEKDLHERPAPGNG